MYATLTHPNHRLSSITLPPYPNGWYAVGFSDELQRGKLIARPLAGDDIIVFRTTSGQVCAAHAYCPHMGAHLGHGGRIEGELLRCPFHGFCYDTNGTCVKTGYGSPPPPKARLSLLPVREKHGILLVYYHAQGQPPIWEIPDLEFNEWTPLYYRGFTLYDHPQETTENSVDIGHFAFVHGYEQVAMTRDALTDGVYLSTAYRARRRFPILGKNNWIDFEYETHIYGLGYSLVHVNVPRFNLIGRLWVLPTPIDHKRVRLYLAVRTQKTKSRNIHPALALFPSSLLNPILARGLLAGLAHDAGQDFEIWQNKKYIHPPALAKGDGPIGKYRQWAKQFYSQTSEDVQSVRSDFY